VTCSRLRNDLRERHRSEAVRAKTCPRAPAHRRFSLTHVLRHSRFQPRRRIQQDRPTTESRQHQEGFLPGHTADITAAQTRWCWFPPRLHTPTPAIPARQRAGSPASTVEGTQTSVRITCELRRHRSGLRVCAGHRPGPWNLMTANTEAVWIPPPGISRGPLTGVSAGQRHSHALGGR
jgi:hypothetical protein